MYSISCIVPVYNEGKILKHQMLSLQKCFEEVQADYEIILVNDGSRDNTLKVIDSLVQRDSHFKKLNNEINLNMGISVQRGFCIASKEYVTFNAVDLPLNPAKYAELIEEMRDNDIELLVVEREKYLGTTVWRRITSFINRAMMKILFPKLKNGLSDTNYVQIVKRECIKDILPLAKSPIFTWPEMIFRAKLKGIHVVAKTVEYNPSVVRKGAFGKPNDIIWGIYDMLRFRIREWKNDL